VWVDRAKARRRSWKIAGWCGAALAVLAGLVLSVLAVGG
jgi:hypothetical protein